MMRRQGILMPAAIALVAALLPLSSVAGVLPDPEDAPDWEISEWINGDPGRRRDHLGRVILVEFFQLWCPGCNSFSIPLFKRWDERYGHRDDVLIVSIHSVFEGHDYQTPERLREFVRRWGIRHPVGIDAYGADDIETPQTMKSYDTDGSPHIVIIDKRGEMRFSHFGRFDVGPVEAFIDRLLKEPAAARPARAKPVLQTDPRLSGRYSMVFRQTAKSCGRKRSPVRIPLDLEVLPDKIRARSQADFMNIQDLTVDFDPLSGTFETRTEQSQRVDDAEVNLSLRLEGRFTPGKEPPEFEIEMKLEKTADKPGWECTVEAEGHAKRTGP